MNDNEFNPINLPSKIDRHKLFGSVNPGPKSKPTEKNEMADLQNTKKDFMFDIDAVGIANVKHPITVVSNIAPTEQSTIGEFTFTSSIHKEHKGTNMSRFTEQLTEVYNENGFTIRIENLKNFVLNLAKRLEQKDASMTLKFPWFYERKGPYSKLSGMNHAEASITVTFKERQGFKIEVGLEGKVTTLCPCSKEISEYSAHNQRGVVKVNAELTEDFDEQETDWKEALLEAMESNASARLHPVLKRPDEKIVTELAYENPRFVEDMVRLVAADLYEMDFVSKFSVTCRNEESIHLHDAIH